PEHNRGGHLEDEKDDGEAGEEITFKLLAGTTSGKRFRLRREKAGGILVAGDFVVIKLFQSLFILEAHLEITDEGGEKADAEQDGANLAGDTVAVAAK